MARAARKIPEGSWPRLMTRERAAAYLDISVAQFMALIASRFPPVSIASRKLWDREALDRWLDDRDQEADNWLRAFDDDHPRQGR
jgi:hypothetical protein